MGAGPRGGNLAGADMDLDLGRVHVAGIGQALVDILGDPLVAAPVVARPTPPMAALLLVRPLLVLALVAAMPAAAKYLPLTCGAIFLHAVHDTVALLALAPPELLFSHPGSPSWPTAATRESIFADLPVSWLWRWLSPPVSC